MPIMPPDSPLWHEVVAEEGLDAVWVLDSEENARQLQTVWAAVADDVGEGGFQVSQAAGVVASSWPDRAGAAAVDAVTAYFDRIKEAALQMAWVGLYGLSYADDIERAKNAVRDTIARWEESYAAAGVPQPGKDTAYEQSLVVYYVAQACFKIIDDAVRDVSTTLATRAADGQTRTRKGGIDATRQIGNVLALAGTFNWAQNQATLATATALKTAVDVETGKPTGQAVVSNWSGAAVNVGVGLGLRSLGPLGMLAGMTAGAFTSGAVDSLYENGPTHLATAMDRGAERVADTFTGMGDAIGSAGRAVADLFSGEGT